MTYKIAKFHKYIDKMNKAGIRKFLFYETIAASIKKTVGEHTAIRRGKAFSYLLNNTPKLVLPGEILVGTMSGLCPVADKVSYQDRKIEGQAAVKAFIKKRKVDPLYLKDDKSRFALISRDHYEGNVEYRDMQSIISDLQEENSKSPYINSIEIATLIEDTFEHDYGVDMLHMIVELPWYSADHMNLNYKKTVKTGLGEIKEIIIKRLEENLDDETKAFFDSELITVNAIMKYISDYADAIDGYIKQEDNEARITELKEMQTICRKIAYDKPETFHQAVQLVWFIHVIGNIQGGCALAFGRFDRYMAPFYEGDVLAGRLTSDKAYDIIGSLFLKVNEPRMRTVQSMTIGGCDEFGNDITSDLTRLILEVAGDLKRPFPNIAVRLGKSSPEWLYDLTVDTIKKGFGNPMVLNEEVWTKNMFEYEAYRKEDAINFFNMGCVETMLEGCMPVWAGGGGVSFPGLVLEILASDQATQLDTFDKFMELYLEKIRTKIRSSVDNPRVYSLNSNKFGRSTWISKYATPEFIKKADELVFYEPFASLFVDDCLSKGKNIYNGGARYQGLFANGGGSIGTATDSLGVIKKYVYDDKKLSLAKLKEVLDKDYVGYEDLMLEFKNCKLSLGNDIEEIDDLAAQVMNTFLHEVKDLNKTDIPGRSVASLFSYTSQVSSGEMLGATPNGRRYGEYVSDNAGPSQGKDVKGPTSLLNSLLRYDSSCINGAYAMNIKITPSILQTKNGTMAFKTMIKAYLQAGGPQIQCNIVDSNTLKEAQKSPEKYSNLVVRVAGFCEYFANLDRKLQNEIINRMEYAMD